MKSKPVKRLASVDSWWLERLIAGAPTRDGDSWPKSVPVEDMYADYVAASGDVRSRLRSGSTAFGIAIRKLVPFITRFKGSADESGRHRWMYRLPPLSECRAAFEAYIGQVYPWDGDKNISLSA